MKWDARHSALGSISIRRATNGLCATASSSSAPVSRLENRIKPRPRWARYSNLWRSERTIYLITCMENDFPVKIGSAIDLTGRLATLATALPWAPVLLASFNGDRTDETKLHKRFEGLRMRGEWFRRTPELMDFAASIRKFETLQPVDVPPFAVSRALSMGSL